MPAPSTQERYGDPNKTENNAQASRNLVCAIFEFRFGVNFSTLSLRLRSRNERQSGEDVDNRRSQNGASHTGHKTQVSQKSCNDSCDCKHSNSRKVLGAPGWIAISREKFEEAISEADEC